MLKKLLLIFILFSLIMFLFRSEKTKMVFLDDSNFEEKYTFYYDNLTTKTILDELDIFKNKNVDIYMDILVGDNVVSCSFNSSDMERKMGEFFNKYIDVLDDQKEIDRVYLNGFVIKKISIIMTNNLASLYLKDKKWLKYEKK